MTLQEYYEFPEGTKFNVKYYNTYDTSWPDGVDFPTNMSSAFSYETKRSTLKDYDFSPVKDMSYMLAGCKNLITIPPINPTGLTDTYNMFEGCSSLLEVPLFDTSKVGDCSYMFKNCTNLKTIPEFNTRSVSNMTGMLEGCNSLESIPPMNCQNVDYNMYPLNGSSISNYDKLTDIGGFLNMYSSWVDYNGLRMCQNLTYQSCVNILNGLYDFTGNGEEADGDVTGRLRVHANFLTTVGDKISIATDKGWTIIS